MQFVNIHQEMNQIFTYCFRLPFDDESLIGYFIGYCISSGAAFCTFYCHYLVFCLLIGLSWLSITIVDDFTNEVNDLNARKRTHDTQQELRQRIISLIQLHCDSKQLSSLKPSDFLLQIESLFCPF